jgi:hypothetical protein
MLHPDLDAQKQAFIHFRASQKKFTATGDNIFSVVDYSVPYAFARLNDDIIVLLASLGITTEKLLLKQEAYFKWITDAGTSWEVAFDFLSSMGNFALAEKLLLEGIDSPAVQSKIHSLQNSELASFRKNDRFRTRMLIHKSRFLFGICDPYQVLREGEVHVRISVPRKGGTTLTQMDLLVVRNPCLHPGDCLKLRAVAHPRLSHLVDCIVFPTVGRRAAPSMSSGGDLGMLDLSRTPTFCPIYILMLHWQMVTGSSCVLILILFPQRLQRYVRCGIAEFDPTPFITLPVIRLPCRTGACKKGSDQR